MNTLLAVALVCGATPVEPRDPGPYTLKAQPFVEMARRDLVTLHRFINGMASVSARVTENRGLFAMRREEVYSPDQKVTLLSTWGALFGYFSAAESLRQKYWGFIRLPPTDVRHGWGYLVVHTALTALLAHGTAFADLTINNPQLETLFDEANDEFGVPPGAFAVFKRTSIHLATTTQLVTGDLWSPMVLPVLKTSGALNDREVTWAMQEMRRNSSSAKSALGKKGVKLFAGNATDILKDGTAQAVFPAQKTFAEWMGDTRVARQGEPLMSRQVIDAVVVPKLRPGDVLTSRQNWFLSNIGLPGFWPHAMLYLGTAEELAHTFDADEGVRQWAAAQPEQASNLTELLARRYPAKWKAYSTGTDYQGHGPIRVIESVSEGVSFTAVEHAFGVDYLAALRPRLPLSDKARAIERAFFYQGRPYDFDFDFFSDATLVCTELVYKAYQPSSGRKGLHFELVDVAGRRTLPANEILKGFDRDFDSPDRQFDFVLFVDGREKPRTTVEADAQALRKSWRRTKWDVAQK